jgi:predicted glycogen debranching enzyme
VAGSAVTIPLHSTLEWLEADGLGGFASGTASGIRTRRYHALLLTATTPPTGRFVLVNSLEAWVETPAGNFALSSHRYLPGVVHPDGVQRLESFEADPWPRWTYRLQDGTHIRHELFVPHGSAAVALSWRLLEKHKSITLGVRPLLSGRDYHSLHQANGGFQFEPDVRSGQIVWRPYSGVPGVVAFASGLYTHSPEWYRRFFYEEERARGLDCVEDLAAPGIFRWDLGQGEAFFLLAAEGHEQHLLPAGVTAEACFRALRLDEQRRRDRLPSRLDRSAEAYLVRRGDGKSIVAGYPWFTDWGRDTFIALRGLCLARGRLDDARAILLEWAGAVSEGMLPNRFPDRGEEPEFNSVDASLWFVVAVYDFLEAMRGAGHEVDSRDEQALTDAVESILAGCARGTRYGIRLDDDGLLAAGQPGLALTWMDALVRGVPVTPRSGKPVEVQALWLNALYLAGRASARWREIFVRGLETFRRRFWNGEGEYLFDVVDVEHRPGTADFTFRPNQIFAVGGLPLALLEGEQARRVVEQVEARLLTPLGLRTLAPGEPGYVPRYQGGATERDGAYHQGTAWPWLLGPFVEAWVRVRGNTAQARREARARFLAPLLGQLDAAGLGHLPEIADAEPPHTPRGCPFQAWSLAEALRLDHLLALDEDPALPHTRAADANPNGEEVRPRGASRPKGI